MNNFVKILIMLQKISHQIITDVMFLKNSGFIGSGYAYGLYAATIAESNHFS